MTRGLRYSYNFDLPEPIAEALSGALAKLAAELGASFDLWYHDLPSWCIWKEQDGRVNRIQIDAIIIGDSSVLLIRPDAYEDMVTEKNGAWEVSRAAATAAAISDNKAQISVRYLVEQAKLGKDIWQPLLESLRQAWGIARKLPLEHRRTWTTRVRPAIAKSPPPAAGVA